MPGRTRSVIIPTRPRDIAWNEWVRDLRAALALGWEHFATAVGAPSRDTVAKWAARANPQEPGFTYTRRMVTIAPQPLVRSFLGGVAPPATSGVDRSAEVRPAMTKDAVYIAEKIDEITDPDQRLRAVRGCLKALEEARNPHELSAENRPDRAQRR